MVDTSDTWAGNWTASTVFFYNSGTSISTLTRLERDLQRADLEWANMKTHRSWVSGKSGRPYHLRKWYR
jgi:hypothetical protein